MYAIVRVGGKQYHAEPGKTFVTEKLPYEVGTEIDLDDVLLISDGDNSAVGQPVVAGAHVKVEVTEQFKGKKIIVFKYKPKTRYRVKQGHRQNYTRLLVKDVVAGKAKAKKEQAAEEPVVEEPAAEPAAEAEAEE
jgi:large subunit ribosomal protein L21